jgi:hypothetical protein
MSEVVFNDKEVTKFLGDLTKKIKKTKDAEKAYVGLLSIIVFRDIMDHFDKDMGSDGKWPDLSPNYAAWKREKGYEKTLAINGKLRGGLMPIKNNRYTKTSGGILWKNTVKYSGKHEYGEGVPKRDMMWLSDSAMEEISKETLQFLLDERF